MKARLRAPLGAARRYIAARLAAAPQPPYVQPSLDALDHKPTVSGRMLAPFWLAVGRFMETVEQPTRALTAYVRASAGGAPTAIGHASRLALMSGPPTVQRQPNLGLVVGHSGDFELARELVGRRAAPASEREAADRALALARLGDFDDAYALLTGFEGTPALRARGEILQLRSRERGGLLVSEAHELSATWSDLLTRDPSDHQRRQRLVRHLVSMGDFEGARRQAWPLDPKNSRAAVGLDTPENAPVDWLYALHAEQLAAGRPVAAHETKLAIADRVAHEPRRRAEPLWQLVERTRGLSYLDKIADARHELASQGPLQRHPRDRLAVEKLAADIALSDGEVDPIIAVRRRLASPTTDAEHAFRRVVEGASVLVVGPAPSTQPDAATLAAADVVVTTKRQRPLRDGQTSVTYVSDASALLEPERIVRDHGNFSVLRPSMVAVASRSIPTSPTVRVMQCEDLNTFLGTRFGIQRLLYDLVAYRPGELVLSGVDFFLGDAAYIEGYDNEVADIYGPQDLQPVLSVAPHDHLWDFRFTQRLFRHGLITASSGVEDILQLEEPQYLEQLEHRLGSS